MLLHPCHHILHYSRCHLGNSARSPSEKNHASDRTHSEYNGVTANIRTIDTHVKLHCLCFDKYTTICEVIKPTAMLSSFKRQISAHKMKAGVDGDSIVVSKIQGAHPGGTSAIGSVVDKDLQTDVDNLFVCDSSVLPTSPGLPPILTIAALAKRLVKTIL